MGTTPPPGGWSDESDPGFNEAYTGTPPRCRAAAAKQGEIRLAVIHATCNERTDPTQRLGAPEAGCQAALVNGHEAALEEEKRLIAEHLDPASGSLTSHHCPRRTLSMEAHPRCHQDQQ